MIEVAEFKYPSSGKNTQLKLTDQRKLFKTKIERRDLLSQDECGNDVGKKSYRGDRAGDHSVHPKCYSTDDVLVLLGSPIAFPRILIRGKIVVGIVVVSCSIESIPVDSRQCPVVVLGVEQHLEIQSKFYETEGKRLGGLCQHRIVAFVRLMELELKE